MSLTHVFSSVSYNNSKLLIAVIVGSIWIIRVSVRLTNSMSTFSDQFLEINMSVIDFEFLNND